MTAPTVPAGSLRAGDEITISTEDGHQVRAFVRAVASRKGGHDVRLQSGTRAATVGYRDAERVERTAEARWAA